MAYRGQSYVVHVQAALTKRAGKAYSVGRKLAGLPWAEEMIMTWEKIMNVILWIVLLIGGYMIYAKTHSHFLGILTVIGGALAVSAMSQVLMMIDRHCKE